MHDSTTVLDGLDHLVDQVRQVVPSMGLYADADTLGNGAGGGGVGALPTPSADLFSLAEMREELERLREEQQGHWMTAAASTAAAASAQGAKDHAIRPLPAIVPVLPRGLYVTREMQSVLDAVLSDTRDHSPIGFCGMGGIGKTTVSTWVVRNTAVRERFGMVAWVTLGQTPMLDACTQLLYLQLTGTELARDITPEQTQGHLQQAFVNRSVLVVLDDCWDAAVLKHFNYIDSQNTNSKILISSRIHDVLEGRSNPRPLSNRYHSNRESAREH